MGTRVYVGNLSYHTDEAGLREACAAGGREVVSVSIVTDRMTGQPRGFAFVEFGSEKDAQAAITELHGKTLDGRTLAVNEARDRAPRCGGGAGRGPQDEVPQPRLGLERDEHDAARRHGARSREDQPRHLHVRPVLDVKELAARDDAAFSRASAKVAHGVIVDREAEPRVVEAKLLDLGEPWKDDVGLVRPGSREELTPARRAHFPHRLTAAFRNQIERPRLGERVGLIGAELGTNGEIFRVPKRPLFARLRNPKR